jgi:hypothetical protein
MELLLRQALEGRQLGAICEAIRGGRPKDKDEEKKERERVLRARYLFANLILAFLRGLQRFLHEQAVWDSAQATDKDAAGSAVAPGATPNPTTDQMLSAAIADVAGAELLKDVLASGPPGGEASAASGWW